MKISILFLLLLGLTSAKAQEFHCVISHKTKSGRALAPEITPMRPSYGISKILYNTFLPGQENALIVINSQFMVGEKPLIVKANVNRHLMRVSILKRTGLWVQVSDEFTGSVYGYEFFENKASPSIIKVNHRDLSSTQIYCLPF